MKPNLKIGSKVWVWCSILDDPYALVSGTVVGHNLKDWFCLEEKQYKVRLEFPSTILQEPQYRRCYLTEQNLSWWPYADVEKAKAALQIFVDKQKKEKQNEHPESV